MITLKIIFTDNLYKLNEQMNINDFCSMELNKIVVLSPTVLNVRIPENVEPAYNDGILLVAPYDLSRQVFKKEEQFNFYGPGLEKNLINWAISYYSLKYNRSIDDIEEAFFYTNRFLSYDQYHNDILHADYSAPKVSSKLERTDKKILFSTGCGLVWGGEHLKLFKQNEAVLTEYLKDGNYLVLVESTGHHIGIPFVQGDKYYDAYYQEMADFFQRLSIRPQQVIDFKSTFVGICYNGETVNFGWNLDASLIVDLYLDHIFSSHLYAIDGFKDFPIARRVEKLGGESLNIDLNNSGGEVSRQFSDFVKRKVLGGKNGK